MAETMNEEFVCPICSMENGEYTMLYSRVPSMCWLKVSKFENGFIGMTFGCGEVEPDHLFYYPKYCPECGRKNEYIVAEERITV